jgi:hypothetical protein
MIDFDEEETEDDFEWVKWQEYNRRKMEFYEKYGNVDHVTYSAFIDKTIEELGL